MTYATSAVDRLCRLVILPVGRLSVRTIAVASIAAGLVLGAQSATAQQYAFAGGKQRLANLALASYGLVAIPNPVSSLSVNSFNNNGNSLRSLQFGGGFTPFEDVPLYLEGYAGYLRYKPNFVLNDGTQDLNVGVKWTGISATGGVGYNFPLSDNWTLRPILNFSYGQIESDVTVTAPVPAGKTGDDLNFLASGEIRAAGYGGSLLLEYKVRDPSREYDISFRHTQMKLQSVGKSSGLNARANVGATTAWARARYPIHTWRAFNNPVRSVWQAGITALTGDQGDALGIDWVATIGMGVELDTDDTPLPFVKRARLMLNYVVGNDFDAVSLGFGVSF